ncbi:MAG: hypothetical protein ACPGQS_08025 [Bradymonadia bacterium]
MSFQTNNRERINMNCRKSVSFKIVAIVLALGLFACGGAPKKPGFDQKELDKRQSDSFRELDRT